MTNSFETLCRSYLASFQADCETHWAAGATSTELATRPTVTAFIDDLGKLITDKVQLHHETATDRHNRPDWWLSHPDNFGVYCYADHKGLRLDGPFQLAPRERMQVQRYLALGRPVFVFDGIEFTFYNDTIDEPVRIDLVPKPLSREADWSTLDVNPAVETLFRKLLVDAGFRRWSESDLMHQLAILARLMADSVELLLEAPTGSGIDRAENELINAIHELWTLLSTHHDPNLADRRACADFVAQVLAFGLFFAHTTAPHENATPDERSDAIAAFWKPDGTAWEEATSLRPFRALVEYLSPAFGSSSDLGSWFQHCRELLAHAEFMGAENSDRDFHSLFEEFLEAYDSRLRFDRGAFYTPPELTRWMARTADRIVQSSFGVPLIAGADRIIDPCCGTGGYLEALIRLFPDPIPENHPELVGFEVLPAPYALAHYRLALVRAEVSNASDVRVLLTDTLADQLVAPPGAYASAFFDELREASSLTQPPIRVVIGNPPSSDREASGAPRDRIHRMMNDFRPPEAERHGRQNIQQATNNEAYRFLRWSAERILEAGSGLLALVLPGSFANAVSLKWARRWLQRHFDDIWILMIDKDVRTGAPSSSLFSVRQGRLVLFANLNPSEGRRFKNDEIGYADLREKAKEDKSAWLDRDQLSWDFARISVDSSRSAFVPSNPYPEHLWAKCWPIRTVGQATGIFESQCSGVKAAPARFLIHTDPLMLQRRGLSVGAKSRGTFRYSYSELRTRWWQGQQRPPAETKFPDEVRDASATAFASVDSFAALAFRPFVPASICLDLDLLSALTTYASGDGTRRRPELMAAFAGGAYGIAVSPSTIDLGDSLDRFCSFAWSIPDNDLAARGNAMMHPNLYPRNGDPDNDLVQNLSAEINEVFGDDSGDAALFYAYAILSSEAYLDHFKGVLFTAGDRTAPQRVPIASNESDRSRLAELGRAIADCERADYVPTAHPNLEAHYDGPTDEFHLTSFAIDGEARTIELNGTDGRVLRIEGVPDQVARLRISGHAVVKGWLRERTFPYLRRAFTSSDASELIRVLSAIIDQIDLLEEVDEIVAEVLDSEDVIEPQLRPS